MKARLVRATTEERQCLGEVLPLDTPFGINILPTNVCNFQCIYCGHNNRPEFYRPQYLEWADFQKCIDDIKNFPQKIKTLLFTGLGEPLLHPMIGKMIKYAKDASVAKTIRVITNGSMLTKSVSDELIEGGLDALKISIQGTSDAVYRKMCQSPVLISQIIDNIRYFYEHKTNTVVNIKIVDEALEDDCDRDKFFRIFGDICDIINIEFLQEYPESDSSKFERRKDVNQSGEENTNNKICPIPFYYYSLYPDGEIVPSCALFFDEYKSISLGNIKENDMAEIWTSEKFNRFRHEHLLEHRYHYKACSKCDSYINSLCRIEDRLDEYKEKLLKVF